MKKSEIREGGLYLAKVNGQITTVRVDKIRTVMGISRDETRYDVTNLKTGRTTMFRSAAKFRAEVNEEPCPRCNRLMKNSRCQSCREASTPTVDQARMMFAAIDLAKEKADARADFDAIVQERIELAPQEEEACEESDPTVGDAVITSMSTVSETNDAQLVTHPAQDVSTVECEDEQRSDPTTIGAATDHITGVTIAECPPTMPQAAPIVATGVQPSKFAANIAAARVKREVGTAVAGMVPNDEQESILAIAQELQELNQQGMVLVINAGAGTGKTSTDRMLEQVLTGIGQYTAFNKALVEESKVKFKKASVNTTYALAFRAVGRKYSHRLNADRVKSWQVAQMLGMTDLTIVVRGKGAPLERGSDEWLAFYTTIGYRDYAPPVGSEGERLLRSMNNNLDDEEARLVYADWLEDQGRVDHAEFIRNPCRNLVKTFKADFLAGQVREAIRRFCQSADPVEYISDHIYSQAVSPMGDEAKRQFREYLIPFVRKMWTDLCDPDGKLPFDHICYVKMWQLGTGEDRPIIAADYILLDEAQDTPPVFLDILRRQKHALLILVGDDNQQIYEFLGAVNAMSSFKGAPRRLLSQSYRFGQAVADVANAVLDYLEEPTDLVMKGNPEIPSRIAELANPRCYLYRSNAGAVSRVMVEFEAGKRPHLIGGGEDTVKWCQAALDLQHRKKTSHPDLCCFDSWGEVEEYSKTDEGADLRLMVKLVNSFGAEKIIQALKNMPKEADADLVVSTAHKSKGREWPTVKLGGDFPLANKMSDGEVRLLYVAATRAQHTLDISECPPFCGGEDRAAEGGETRWIPGIQITYTKPMPTEAEQLEWQAKKGTSWRNPALPKPPVQVVQQRDEPTDEEIAVITAPKFTWAKVGDKWGVRGPMNVAIGTKVKVERRDGSVSEVTIHEVAYRNTDTWIYKV